EATRSFSSSTKPAGFTNRYDVAAFGYQNSWLASALRLLWSARTPRLNRQRSLAARKSSCRKYPRFFTSSWLRSTTLRVAASMLSCPPTRLYPSFCRTPRSRRVVWIPADVLDLQLRLRGGE